MNICRSGCRDSEAIRPTRCIDYLHKVWRVYLTRSWHLLVNFEHSTPLFKPFVLARYCDALDAGLSQSGVTGW